MAHFAQIGLDNKVIRVTPIEDQYESIGQEYLSNTLGLTGTWVQTSYNTYRNKHRNGKTPFRKNYASIGYTYDSSRDAFIPPKPYPSWVLNEETCWWYAPSPYPTNGKRYRWDEPSLSWVEIVPTSIA